MTNRFVVVLALSLLTISGQYRTIAWALFLAWLAISVAFGEKFTSLLMMVCMIVVPIALLTLSRAGRLPVLKLVTALLLAGAVSIPIIITVYSGVAAKYDIGLQRLLDRAAVQGQMWYVTDLNFGDFSRWDGTAISKDIVSWYTTLGGETERAGVDYGLYYLMAPYASPDAIRFAMKYNVGPIFNLYPYWLMVSGYLGVFVIMLGSAIVYGVASRLLLTAICRLNVFALLSIQKSISLIISGIIVGYSSLVFGAKPFLMLGLGGCFLAITQIRADANARTRIRTDANTRRRV
jgi:hypothetical protein